jgi:carbon monoxide dehydrogenase subunit G
MASILWPQVTRVHVNAYVHAPIEEVFDFFDDPDNTLEFNEHAERFEVVEVRPDGRRTIDVVMQAGRKRWMQTVEQVVRDPPTRLTTRGGTWTTQRDQLILKATTDRRFSVEGDGTRVDVAIDLRLQRPLQRPFWAVLGWLQRGAARRQFEHQMSLVAQRLAERGQPTPFSDP